MVVANLDSRHSGSSATQQNKQETDNHLEFLQKRLKVLWVGQNDLKAKNVLWLSPQDADELFRANEKKYVQIANHIYRIAVGSRLERGWIGIGDHRHQEIADGVSKLQGILTAVVGPADFNSDILRSLESVSFDLELVNDYVGSDNPIVITTSELREKLMGMLEEDAITAEKSYYLDFPWGAVVATVDDFISHTDFADKVAPYRKVGRFTHFNFSSKTSSHIRIVDEIYDREVERFCFSASLQKRTQSARNDLFPLVLEEDELMERIREQMSGKVVVEGQTLKIQHSTGWDIHVVLKKAPLKGLYQKVYSGLHRFNKTDYEKAYLISENAEIELTPSKDILLTESFPEHAAKMIFRVADIPGIQMAKGIDHTKECWVSLEEFAEEIRKYPHALAVNQTIELHLRSGTFLVCLDRVKPLSPVLRDPDEMRKPCWSADLSTVIEVTAQEELDLNLMRDSIVHPLKKVTVQLKAERFPQNGLSMTAESLERYVRTYAPGKLVEKQKFAIETKTGHLLRCAVQYVQTEEEIHLADGVNVFGSITDETEIELFTKHGEHLTIVNEIHKDDVEKIRISVNAKKRAATGKWTKPPLIVSVPDVMKRVIKELAKYEYFYDSHTAVIPFEKGWDLFIKLDKIVLKQLSKETTLDDQVYTGTRKEAYALGELTELEFISANKDIIFTDGKPVFAKAVTFRVVDIKDDFTDRDPTLVKGNWINVEELKEALVGIDREFYTGETLLVELESGKYLIEVKKGTPNDKNDLGDLGLYRNPWKIDGETKIHLGAASKVETSIISTGEIYPLKKIKLVVFPENPTSEHLTIKDAEIKRVFKEHTPEKIVLNQVFSLEMKSGEAVRMVIEELEFDKRKWTQGKRGLFGKITDETEIQISGKQESNIAVQGQPKILEIDDPIKYLENLGLAGIDDQFNQIYRIFFSRSTRLRAEAQKRGTTPIRGIMLFGPPGTGKTTLARHIGDMLGCSGDRLKMITATEIFNMWLGESERNVRELFVPAREASDKYGDKSPLYVVVIDEIDALLPKRGGGTNKVYDKIVNQFLGEMDGLNQLNNLLVIGITNRKDEIDPAAMRHGRFGAHIEIGLPDKKGRQKIFEIHTRKLAEEGILDDGVDIAHLAERTDKYSGAAIEGLIEEASLYSLERLHKHRHLTREELSSHKDGIVTMADFLKALEGRKEDEEMSESVQQMYR